jgi:transcription antitermination factor NusG
MSEAAWYALRCATRQEEAAQARLAALGHEVLLPVEVRWRRTRRERVRASRPLFLGYLFVRCPRDALFAIGRVDGVHHPVGWRDAEGLRHPIVIPDDAIAEIVAEQQRGLHDHTCKAAYRPAAGDHVRIVHGLWSGRLAQVLAAPAGARAALLLEGDFAGRITAAVSALAPAAPQAAANPQANLRSSTNAA